MTFMPRELRSFRSNDNGGIAILFCVVLTVVVFAIGMAIDYGRAMQAGNKVTDAMDSAALAAAQFMTMTPDATDADVIDRATSFFSSNLEGAQEQGINWSNLRVDLNRETGGVSIAADVTVPTSFTRLAGFQTLTMAKSSEAVFKMKGVELAMVLDTTGSMGNDTGKIEALKQASKDVVDIMIPDSGPSLNRIALAPYGAAVNIGALAAPFTDNTDGGVNCVVERDGAFAYTDDVPGLGRYFNPAGPTTNPKYTGCTSAEILPLTKDKVLLKNTLDALATGGNTAGHIGIGWGWYEISPVWSGIWQAASQPKPYGDPNTIKAMIVMTDGKFNTSYFNGVENETSLAQAGQLCTNIKAQGVLIYTVGFFTDAAERTAGEPVLQGCASEATDYFLAENAVQLNEAFQAIARKLTTLRLSK